MTDLRLSIYSRKDEKESHSLIEIIGFSPGSNGIVPTSLGSLLSRNLVSFFTIVDEFDLRLLLSRIHSF